jgi:hypothetical protein
MSKLCSNCVFRRDCAIKEKTEKAGREIEECLLYIGEDEVTNKQMKL